jgi:hypothetical protein
MINMRRLWIFLTATWVVIISASFLGNIQQKREDAYFAFEKDSFQKSEKETNDTFNSCLESHGITRLQLDNKYRGYCIEQNSEGCNGIWCLIQTSTSYHGYDPYIRSQFPLCLGKIIPHETTEKDKSEYIKNADREFLRKQNQYFWESHYSRPLKIYLILIFLVPAIMAIAPFIWRVLIRWLKYYPQS